MTDKIKSTTPRSAKSKLVKALNLSKTLAALRKSSAKKPKIVFTNGCFDLLHAGHVQYLEAARKLGDYLVVALNSDQSVRKLKGASRPINALADREAIIASLECVDFVTSFTEDTPLKTILMLKPTFIVKGGDWDIDKIVGVNEAREWGGEPVSLPFLEGKSTTAIVKKMRS